MTRIETGWNSAVTLHDDGRVSVQRATMMPAPMFLHMQLTAAEVQAIRRLLMPSLPSAAVEAPPLNRRATCPVCQVDGLLINYSSGGLRVHCPGQRTSRDCAQTCTGSGQRPT